ncbi:MAG: helix-turn-helix domain-containing protein [Paraclostridium sordellii]
MEYIGENIKNLRKFRGFSQSELAKNICSQSELSKIENAKLYPSLYVCYEISKKLDVTLDELIKNKFDFLEQEQTEKLLNLFYTQKYRECLKFIDNLHLFKSSNNRQLILYVKSACKFYLNGKIDTVTDELEESLYETYTDFKKNHFPIEIQILNLLGVLYKDINNKKSEMYITKSHLILNSRLPKDIHFRALSKCFYNSAKIYLEKDKKNEARKTVLNGIRWCLKNQSLYFLSDLYELLIIINIELGEHHLIKKTEKIFNSLKLINNNFI